MKHSLLFTLAFIFSISACGSKSDSLKADSVQPSLDADKVIRRNEWCVVADPKDTSQFNIPSDRRVIARLSFSGYETSAGSVSGKWYAIKGRQAITFPMELRNSDRWVHTGPTPEVLTRSYGMVLTLDQMSGGSPKDNPLVAVIDNQALAGKPPYRLVIKSPTFSSGVAVAYPCALDKIRFSESYEQTSSERSYFQNYMSSARSGSVLPEMVWPFRAVNLNSYYIADKTWCSIQNDDASSSEISITRFNSNGTSSVWKIRTRNSGEILRYVYALPNADQSRNGGSSDFSGFQESGGVMTAKDYSSASYSTKFYGFTDARGMNVLMPSSGKPQVECRAFRDANGVYQLGRYNALSGNLNRDGLTIEPGAELIYRALGF